MRPRNTPSSKGRKSGNTRKKVDLGDETTTSSSGEDLASDFDSPEKDDSVTDYGLDFTNNNNNGRPFLSEKQKRRLSQQAVNKIKSIRLANANENRDERSEAHVEHQAATGSGTGVTDKGDGDMEQHSKPTQQQKQLGTVKKVQLQQKPRKQKNPTQRDKIFGKEVLRLQSQVTNLMPRLPFSRLIREILINTSVEANKITRTALEALQEASEMYLTQILQDAYTLTLHRRRITLAVTDMELLRYIRGEQALL